MNFDLLPNFGAEEVPEVNMFGSLCVFAALFITILVLALGWLAWDVVKDVWAKLFALLRREPQVQVIPEPAPDRPLNRQPRLGKSPRRRSVRRRSVRRRKQNVVAAGVGDNTNVTE